MHDKNCIAWWLALGLALVSAACQPELGGASGVGGGGGSGSGGGEASVIFTFEPEAEAGAARRALRVRVRAREPIDPSRIRLVEGDVGPGHLKQLALDEPSNALEKRLLPASAWTEGSDVVVAAHALLESDARYAIAVPDHLSVLEIRSRDAAFDPTLPRVWPPHEALALEPTLIFCGEADLAVDSAAVALAPGGQRATLEAGAASGGAGKRCVRVQATDPVEMGTMLIPPSSVTSDGVEIGLEPTPLIMGDASIAPASPLLCEPFEAPFGDGCVRLLDDRAIVRTPAAPRLWVVGGAGVDLVVATEAGEPFAIHPLPVEAEVALAVTSFDATGNEQTSTFAGHTSPPAPHLVLNEALANAVGPEPASEWLEIVNDGAFALSLAGYVVADLGGEVELPDVTLGPAVFALLVGDDWTGDGLDDVAPPPGTLIVRVPRIGRSGISNGGEPLRLRDPTGEIVSTIPSIASPDPGMSTARREPWLADAPSSFFSAAPTPGAPNDAP